MVGPNLPIFAETWVGAESQRDQIYRIRGLKSFLYMPPGRLPTLPGEQVISGLRFLCELQANFYRTKRDLPPCAAPKARRRLNWLWGKHAIALAVRAPWGWRPRIQILMLGTRCILSTIWIGRIGHTTATDSAGALSSGKP
jgi:hypothetical protein